MRAARKPVATFPPDAERDREQAAPEQEAREAQEPREIHGQQRGKQGRAARCPVAPATRHRSQSVAAASPTRVTLVMIRSAIHAGSRETSPARTRCPIQFGIGFHEIV